MTKAKKILAVCIAMLVMAAFLAIRIATENKMAGREEALMAIRQTDLAETVWYAEFFRLESNMEYVTLATQTANGYDPGMRISMSVEKPARFDEDTIYFWCSERTAGQLDNLNDLLKSGKVDITRYGLEGELTAELFIKEFAKVRRLLADEDNEYVKANYFGCLQDHYRNTKESRHFREVA
jgi:hypothetical protein